MKCERCGSACNSRSAKTEPDDGPTVKVRAHGEVGPTSDASPAGPVLLAQAFGKPRSVEGVRLPERWSADLLLRRRSPAGVVQDRRFNTGDQAVDRPFIRRIGVERSQRAAGHQVMLSGKIVLGEQ